MASRPWQTPSQAAPSAVLGASASLASPAHEAWLQTPTVPGSNGALDTTAATASRSMRDSETSAGKPKVQRWNDTGIERHRDAEAFQKARVRPWAEPAPEIRRSSVAQKKRTTNDVAKIEEDSKQQQQEVLPLSSLGDADTATLDRIRSAMGVTNSRQGAASRSVTPPPIRQRSPLRSLSPARSRTPLRASMSKAKAARLAMSASLASHGNLQEPPDSAHRSVHQPCLLLTMRMHRSQPTRFACMPKPYCRDQQCPDPNDLLIAKCTIFAYHHAGCDGCRAGGVLGATKAGTMACCTTHSTRNCSTGDYHPWTSRHRTRYPPIFSCVRLMI
jgi:hypothetical protein